MPIGPAHSLGRRSRGCVLSFIYWNNHHRFFSLVPKVDGAIMWANFNLLFWLSLIPFTTA